LADATPYVTVVNGTTVQKGPVHFFTFLPAMIAVAFSVASPTYRICDTDDVAVFMDNVSRVYDALDGHHVFGISGSCRSDGPHGRYDSTVSTVPRVMTHTE
jgi:hypothetical protein